MTTNNKFITTLYFLLAIFSLNYVLLQLFLAILLDGFEDGDNLRDETIYDELNILNKENEDSVLFLIKN
jgi:hypothetical protein